MAVDRELALGFGGLAMIIEAMTLLTVVTQAHRVSLFSVVGGALEPLAEVPGPGGCGQGEAAAAIRCGADLLGLLVLTGAEITQRHARDNQSVADAIGAALSERASTEQPGLSAPTSLPVPSLPSSSLVPSLPPGA